ncbi:hypothetical protein HMPREF0201_01698 [Cedecea davisae DSM 4568]|uniref:Uncharacterized protein n=1 Tax=Cedecea davisae DSM 4568 TaxID=566551 RepID=S3IVH6_9ENTR|nr:hypothetical protein HMPREF0201_01698 [Cedecea davisae DSM 4568]
MILIFLSQCDGIIINSILIIILLFYYLVKMTSLFSLSLIIFLLAREYFLYITITPWLHTYDIYGFNFVTISIFL